MARRYKIIPGYPNLIASIIYMRNLHFCVPDPRLIVHMVCIWCLHLSLKVESEASSINKKFVEAEGNVLWVPQHANLDL